MANDHRLTRAEALLLCDAFNGTYIELGVAPAAQLVAELEDAMSLDQLDEKWRAGHALLDRLKGYDDRQAADLLGRVSNFWRLVAAGADDRDDVLERAGLA